MAEKRKSGAFEIIRIAAILTVICLCVSLVVSLVYQATKETYAANLRAVKEEAIASLFAGGPVSYETLDPSPGSPIGLYRVSRDGAVVGYCANVTSAGFGGDIEMMVAVDPEGELLGVDIIALSETPGLGSRVDDADYLSQYIGLSVTDRPEIGEQIDAISGATISSKAVLAGVHYAMVSLSHYIEEVAE